MKDERREPSVWTFSPAADVTEFDRGTRFAGSFYDQYGTRFSVLGEQHAEAMTAILNAPPPPAATPGVVIGAPSKLTAVAWARERLENTERIAATKTGADRGGWLEDATYWRMIVAALTREAATPGVVSEAHWLNDGACTCPNGDLSRDCEWCRRFNSFAYDAFRAALTSQDAATPGAAFAWCGDCLAITRVRHEPLAALSDDGGYLGGDVVCACSHVVVTFFRAALTDAPLRSCDACGARGPWPVQQDARADRETGHRGTRTLCDRCAPGTK